ncbi:MAG: hypothetical protein PHF33_04250 [Candidatus Delongbacteria bacterium]|nr:hypothetical protein [Candidatus Delongbacteria bacterium]MDD4204621.1 hypothetical protein [Candidatus Delongbacteria bacterium]
MMIRYLTVIAAFLLLFGCATRSKFTIDEERPGTKIESVKAAEDIMTDEEGKEFYKTKLEPHWSKFRWIKNRKVPVYADESKFAEPVTYVYSREFVEVVDGKLGLELTRIRVFNKERGYIEGFTKNKFFFDTDYYSEPYELTEMEIVRRKNEVEKQKKREEERQRKNIEMQKEKEYNLAIATARNDTRSVMKMTYQQLSSYLTPTYAEDLVYTQNATKTLKFTGKQTSLYFSMKEGQVIGLHVINNSDGFSNEDANVLIFELIGEIFYSVEDIENINKYIIRKKGIFEKTEYPMSIKFDNSKQNPIIEFSIGEFTGIE